MKNFVKNSMSKEEQPDTKKPQPKTTDQGISNRDLREEKRRQAKVIPFPEKRQEKPPSEEKKS